MSQFGQLVCFKCRKILSYPLGAVSCRCRNCNTINPAQNLHITCGCCFRHILVPINTLTFLCPCCATITDIPQSLLPLVEGPVSVGTETDRVVKTIYVTYPGKAKPKDKNRKGMKHDDDDDDDDDRESEEEGCSSGGGGNIVMGGKATATGREGGGCKTGPLDGDDDDYDEQLVGDGQRSVSNRHEGSNVIMVVGTRIL
ncbi:hypothetical protein, conserved [Trypanosoma brucei gambiense DAL972]|uniref:Zinc finger LSD1-type domain-containing protein n=1 Tax=Trypanosoma brucei gambiense (strain MHOM/CI/86/DAL972) TaxID=679716 RepID=C9ZT19_TRYB9|nr:hypothetical protein, conserved [Trypanosoma brucei gambiense DAL972]CBH12554.1 hypothetical protein, conserved [Trypanosoma brucei gambiense DAL972]|eukprot:XP_011774834.1 hypothetical protein, conserved [Trypanosoma brucei gambiense DAL972]